MRAQTVFAAAAPESLSAFAANVAGPSGEDTMATSPSKVADSSPQARLIDGN